MLGVLRTCQQALDRVSLWVGYVAGALFFGLAFFITYDVLARKWGDAIGLPTSRVTDELSGYILVLAATWGLGSGGPCRYRPSDSRVIRPPPGATR